MTAQTARAVSESRLAACWVPAYFIDAMDTVAKATGRNRSDLIRDALIRSMTEYTAREHSPQPDPDA